MSKRLSMLEGYGIEAEYMIVHKDTLKIMPIADEILTILNQGVLINEVSLGKTSWSNELVNHVLEIKCTDPEKSTLDLDIIFHDSILDINTVLEAYDAVLMPTAMHPWMNPDKEMQLWSHGNNKIYSQYNKIFDCRGHGWSNLQSIHINLSFNTEKEFRILHSAIRLVLPLIPRLAASSPYYNGKKGESLDNRLNFYEKNQIKVPSIIGNIIPEKIKSYSEYEQMLESIYQDINRFEGSKILQESWLNSRGAIAKFDVGAIEIRLMDIQESPYMDFSLIHFFTKLIQRLTQENIDLIESISDQDLRTLYNESKKEHSGYVNQQYFKIFKLEDAVTFDDFIARLFEQTIKLVPERYQKGLRVIQHRGNLSTRLLKTELTLEKYEKLINCLKKNSYYE